MSTVSSVRSSSSGGRAYTVEYIAPCYADVYGVMATRARYELTIELTGGEADRLARDPDRGGFMTSSSGHSSSMLTVSGIELTAGEARQLASGARPLDVLFPVWPELGYRLVAVPGFPNG